MGKNENLTYQSWLSTNPAAATANNIAEQRAPESEGALLLSHLAVAYELARLREVIETTFPAIEVDTLQK